METSLTQSGLENNVSELICNNFNLDSLLSGASDFIATGTGDIVDDLGSGLRNIDLGSFQF